MLLRSRTGLKIFYLSGSRLLKAAPKFRPWLIEHDDVANPPTFFYLVEKLTQNTAVWDFLNLLEPFCADAAFCSYF